MGEIPLSKKPYFKLKEIFEKITTDYEMEKMMEEVNAKLESNEEYPYLRTNASDCY